MEMEHSAWTSAESGDVCAHCIPWSFSNRLKYVGTFDMTSLHIGWLVGSPVADVRAFEIQCIASKVTCSKWPEGVVISSLDCTSILQLCENSIGKTTSCVNSDDMHQDSIVNQYCSPSVRECSVRECSVQGLEILTTAIIMCSKEVHKKS